jgi:hypothetical protein
MKAVLSRSAAFLLLSFALLPRAAWADGTPPPPHSAAPAAPQEEKDARLLWWLEGRPWSCSDAVGPLARRVELACDASGRRCGVATSRTRASRVAALSCGPDGGLSRLDAEDGDGQLLWSLTLAGDEEARARKAAMWIARAESDGPPQPSDAEVVEAAPPLAFPPRAPSPPAIEFIKPTKDAAGAARQPQSEETTKVAFDASLLSAMPVSSFAPGSSPIPMVGARFAATLPISSSVFLGGAMDGVTTPEANPSTYAHIGGLFALGAPFTHDWFGASAEGGVAIGVHPDPKTTAFGNRTTYDPAGSYGVSPRPYGKVSLVLQLPRETGVRPYFAASFLVSDDAMNRSAMASLGLAWNER